MLEVRHLCLLVIGILATCDASPVQPGVGVKAAHLKTLMVNTKSMSCEGLQCKGGCCPEFNWYCCPGDVYCASDPMFCPPLPQLEMAFELDLYEDENNSEDDCPGTMCPGGCCPLADAYCCDDNKHCTPDESLCPEKEKVKLDEKTVGTEYVDQACPGPMCHGRCCPYEGWVCCPNPDYCALDLSHCPPESAVHFLKSAATKKIAEKITKKQTENCPGPMCHGRCCPYEGWVCCPNPDYCALDLSHCPPESAVHFLKSAAAKKIATKEAKMNTEDCPGPMCHGRCCPYEGWVCCPNPDYCALDLSHCPPESANVIKFLTSVAVNKTKSQDCPGPMCKGGCCPQPGWTCCKDGLYCAATLDDCPY